VKSFLKRNRSLRLIIGFKLLALIVVASLVWPVSSFAFLGKVGRTIGGAVKGAAKATATAATSLGKAVVQPVIVGPQTVLETGKVIIGKESIGKAGSNVKNDFLKVPIYTGQAVNATATAGGDFANLPLVATQTTLGVAGTPGKILGDVLSVPQLAINDGAVTVVSAGGNILQGNNPLQANPFSLALANAILMARDQYKQEAKPIPESVKQVLATTHLFSPHILDKARYTIDSPKIALPEMINTCNVVVNSGVGHAVTVDYIIVFSQEPSPTDYRWWAHELRHVDQYDRWGIQKFAYNYTIGYGSVESEGIATGQQAAEILHEP
jgi:hypothetical protein